MQKWIFIAGGVAVAGAAAVLLLKQSPEEQLQGQWAMVDRYCVECHNDAELTADCVFWTTVLSAVTITGWLIVIRSCGMF